MNDEEYMTNNDEYKIITQAEFDAMMDTANLKDESAYRPLGRFIMHEDGVVIAIDNSSGHANVEEFPNEKEALYWLLNSGASVEELQYEKDEDALAEQAAWIAKRYGADVSVDTVKESNIQPANDTTADFIGIVEDEEVGCALLFYHGPDDYAVWYTNDPQDATSGVANRSTKAAIITDIQEDVLITKTMKQDLVQLLESFIEPHDLVNESYNINIKLKNGESAQLLNRTREQVLEAFNELLGPKAVTVSDAAATVANTLFKSKAITEALSLTGDLRYTPGLESTRAEVNLLTNLTNYADLPIVLPKGLLKNESVKPNGEIHGQYSVDGQAFNIIISAQESWWVGHLKTITIAAEAIAPVVDTYQPTRIMEAYSSSRGRNIAKSVFTDLTAVEASRPGSNQSDNVLKLATLRIWVKQDVHAAVKAADPLLRDSDQGHRLKRNEDADTGTIILSYVYSSKDQRDNTEKFSILKAALLNLGFIVNDDTFERPLDKKRGAISMTTPGAFEQFSLYGSDLKAYGETFAGYIVSAELSVTRSQASVRLKFTEPRGI